MAENILYDRSESGEQLYSLSDNRDLETEISEELNEQFNELSMKESGRKGAKCESCVREECPRSDEVEWSEWYEWYERYERARELYGRVAVFFCFLCKMFVCAECLPKHKTHQGIKVERKESEGKGFMGRIKKRWQKAKRERERNERKKMRREFVLGLANESERTRKWTIFNSHRNVCDRVDVKHELDRTDCRISGLCGLENKRLVVCDWCNFCIKIFKLGSHVLQRYIRFVGSVPRDVTEIDFKQNSTEPNLVSGSSSDISGRDWADSDQQSLIAVTLPGKRQIMFIDLSKKPAKAQKTIKTEGRCYSIQFYDDKIFTVCIEVPDSTCSVYIYSTDGDKLNKFDTDIYRYIAPYLAVVSGRVYITDKYNDKVQCRNVEGQLISEIKIEGSGPAGINVDPDNYVYVCAWGHNEVYKLDADLTRYKSVLDQTTDYIERPDALFYYRDKLFISHGWPPSLQNFVTVVRLL